MPQKVVRFTGINRKVNEFQSTGACEELVNLRPDASGTLRVSKNKAIKFRNANYDVYNHVFADKSLFIGIVPENNFEVYLIDDSGEVSSIDSFNGQGLDYDIEFLGNKIILYHNTEYRVYEYKNNKYNKVDAAIPDDIDITYTVNTGYGYSKDAYPENSNPNDNIFKNAVMEHWSAAIGQNSRVDEIFGPVLVAFNVSLSDGTEFWTNKWLYVNPFLSLPIGENGKNMIYYESGSTKRFTFKSFGVSIKIAQKQFSNTTTENLVKSVNVYASRPIFPYNIDSMSAKTDGNHDREIYATAQGITTSDITKQLLYFQKSIPVSDIEKGDVLVTLDFGESQAGEKVLEVDNGPVKRAGQMVAFNNRIHAYNSYTTIVPQSVVCCANVYYDFYERDAFVHLDCNGTTVVCQTKALVPATSAAGTKISCCYPDARAKKILIATDEEKSGYCTIMLTPSDRFNFAYGEAGYLSSYSTDDIKRTSSYLVYEANTINVSAQYNPFVFPVEYSYNFGGRILDVATSYLPVSSTQIGQYPLSVFTTAGIYTMEQGSGASLYGNIIPLQPQVIDGKATATPYGTFFISSKNIYVLSGRETANISQAVNGERELTLRESDAYKKLCFDKKGYFQDFSTLVSAEDFEDFITGATLIYDQLQNELYISKADTNYSYVFNLDTKAYHKIDKRYLPAKSASRYVIEEIGSNRNVVDLFTEEEGKQPILLQSRPLSLEAFYTHIQRLIMLVDAKLEKGHNLCFSVFGSDNLYDWKCIISAQKQNTVLRQIRTNRAAKSYKDYVILISGLVGTDTDLSDIIADYTVVSRRLG